MNDSIRPSNYSQVENFPARISKAEVKSIQDTVVS